jgi:hypothetical protein
MSLLITVQRLARIFLVVSEKHVGAHLSAFSKQEATSLKNLEPETRDPSPQGQVHRLAIFWDVTSLAFDAKLAKVLGNNALK